MKIESLCAADEPAWDAFVHAHPGASIYHLSGWRHLVADVFGHPSHHLMARDERGTVTGVLPLVRIKSRLFGHYMVSLPYFTYGGPLGVDEETERELMHAAGALAGEHGAGHVEFRGFVAQEPSWPTRTDKVTLHRPLAADEEGLWKSLSRGRRRQVKKASDGKCEVRIGSAELLDEREMRGVVRELFETLAAARCAALVTAELEAIEEIKRLKARYFRLMDTKQWDAWGEVFTRDGVLGINVEEVVAGRGHRAAGPVVHDDRRCRLLDDRRPLDHHPWRE